jgi:hypothetical protein
MEAFWDYKGVRRHMSVYKCFYDVGPRLAKVDQLKEDILNPIFMKFNDHERNIHCPSTIEEFHNAINTMTRGNLVLLDRIVVEFYVRSWHIIKDEYFNMIKSVDNVGRVFKGVVNGVKLWPLDHYHPLGSKTEPMTRSTPCTLTNRTYLH